MSRAAQLVATLLETDVFDKSAFLAAAPRPTITYNRVYNSCSRSRPNRTKTVEVFRCDAANPVPSAFRYFSSTVLDRYQQRDIFSTRRVQFVDPGGPKAIYSTRRLWPPDSCGCTDRYVVTGFSRRALWELDDLMMRFMYGDTHGRGPYTESLDFSVKAAVLAAKHDREISLVIRVWFDKRKAATYSSALVYQGDQLLFGAGTRRGDASAVRYFVGKMLQDRGLIAPVPDGQDWLPLSQRVSDAGMVLREKVIEVKKRAQLDEWPSNG